MNFKFLIKMADKLDEQKTEAATLASNALDFAVAEGVGTEAPYETALAALSGFASVLDEDGHTAAASILDVVLKTAATKGGDDYAKLYDSKENNAQTLYSAVVKEVVKAKEPQMETFKGGNHPLLTRYSPDYPGVMLMRISDGVYQDTLSKKVYDFKNGFVSDTGIRYYGGSVAFQTPSVQNMARSPMVWESQHLKSRPK